MRKLVIVGGGIESAAAAAMIAHALHPTPIDLHVVELEGAFSSASAAPGAVTLSPQSQIHHEVFGFDEAHLLAATFGTFSFGTCFHNWTAPGTRFLQTFESYGADLKGIPFHHLYTRFKPLCQLPPYDHFSLAAMAGLTGRFSHPTDDPRSVLSTLSYGLCLDRDLYTDFLRSHAERKGVTFHRGRFLGVSQTSDGNIEKIELKEGAVSGDFFIDSSGPAAVLMGALGSKDADWSHYFPFDACATYSTAPGTILPSAIQLEATPAYWDKTVSLRHKNVHTRMFDSERTRPDDLRGAATAEDLQALPFKAGCQLRPWEKNAVAFGTAAVRLEPLVFSGLDLLFREVDTFINLLPPGADLAVNAEEYNRVMLATYQRVRDFHRAHYHLGQLGHNHLAPEEANCQSALKTPMAIPDELALSIALFEEGGRQLPVDHELVPPCMWVSLFMGLDGAPTRPHPRLHNLEDGGLEHPLRAMLDVIAQTAARMPVHSDYLARYIRSQS